MHFIHFNQNASHQDQVMNWKHSSEHFD